MRVLITGGAGFIGSHLVDALLAREHEVIALDNLITGSLRNLAHVSKHERYSFVSHDITEPVYLDGPIEAVFHLASLPSPVDYLELPIKTLKVGALGTYNALGLTKAKGARFLLASTSEVYGDPTVHPQPETYWGNVNPIGPRGVYDESKRFAEAITMAYHRYHNVDTRIVRIFNTYGPRMRSDDGRVVPNFVCQALRGEPLTIYDQGKHTRGFCYIDDLVEGIVRLLHSSESLPVNLGNPTEISVLSLSEMVLEITGSHSEIHFVTPEDERTADDPKVRCPDITKARRVLRWEPKVSVEEGLTRTVAYFREKLDLA